MSAARVVVLGASSQIGLFALPMLASCGWQVEAISRQGQPTAYPVLEGVRWVAGDALAIIESLPPAQALVSAGPIELARRFLACHPRTPRIVVFSSSSVSSKTDSPDRQERQQARSIAEAERAIQASCVAASSLCILRPTLVYGCGLDHNLSLLMAWIERFGWLPLSRRAGGLRQPVHASDLAAAAARALRPDAPARLIAEICGGSTLSYRDMVSRLFDAAGRPERILSLPPGLLAALVGAAGLLPHLRGLRASMVYRQASDLVFDDSAARAALGIRPRPFLPQTSDFRRPAAAVIEQLRRQAPD